MYKDADKKSFGDAQGGILERSIVRKVRHRDGVMQIVDVVIILAAAGCDYDYGCDCDCDCVGYDSTSKRPGHTSGAINHQM